MKYFSHCAGAQTAVRRQSVHYNQRHDSNAGPLFHSRYFKSRETDADDDSADVSADNIAARAQALSDRLSSRLGTETPPTSSETGPDGELPSSSYSPSKQGDDLPAKEGGGGKKKRWHVPKRLLVRALALVNIRKTPGVQELDAMMHGGSQARWGNEMGYVMLPLPVNQVGLEA